MKSLAIAATMSVALLGSCGINDAFASGWHGHHHHHRYAYAQRSFVPLPPRRGEGSTIFVRVSQMAHQIGVPVALAHGVVKVESNYRCNASNGNAKGIMQTMTGTARSVGVYGNLHDCNTGLLAGMRYLKGMLVQAGGDWCRAATAYNVGHLAGCSGYGVRVVRFARAYP